MILKNEVLTKLLGAAEAYAAERRGLTQIPPSKSELDLKRAARDWADNAKDAGPVRIDLTEGGFLLTLDGIVFALDPEGMAELQACLNSGVQEMLNVVPAKDPFWDSLRKSAAPVLTGPTWTQAGITLPESKVRWQDVRCTALGVKLEGSERELALLSLKNGTGNGVVHYYHKDRPRDPLNQEVDWTRFPNV